MLYCIFSLFVVKSFYTFLQDAKSKVVTYSITSVWHRADPGFLAVSPQVTLVINPVVGTVNYHQAHGYLPSQRDHPPPPWPVPNYTAWWQRYTGVSSLPKAATQWCPVRTRTRNLYIASPIPRKMVYVRNVWTGRSDQRSTTMKLWQNQ